MLRFILGRSGTGKTAALYQKIEELAHSGEKQIFLLVPDQSSFETEKAFLDRLGPRLCRKVTIFGFDGMCRYVFQQTHTVLTNVIDSGTRAVLMNVALEQLSEKLTLLRSRRPRAVAEMLLETLSECKKAVFQRMHCVLLPKQLMTKHCKQSFWKLRWCLTLLKPCYRRVISIRSTIWSG